MTGHGAVDEVLPGLCVWSGKKKKETYLGFSFEDIVKTNIKPIKVETSVNATTRFEYKIREEGLYVIYFSKEKKVIPFRVK